MIQRRTRNKLALFAVPLATALVLGLGALRTPATDGAITLEASLSAKKLIVRKDGEVIKQYVVAIGQDAHPTPESLGSAASHGCLRMDPDEAGEVALLVMENAGQFHDWDWVKGILHVGDARTVRLATPTPLTITP